MRRIAPAAFLPVTLVVVVNKFNPVQPFDVFHAVNVRDEKSRREPVSARQGFPVHSVCEQRAGFQSLGNSDAVRIPVGGVQNCLRGGGFYACLIEEGLEPNALPLGCGNEVAPDGIANPTSAVS